jgi:molybdopterin-synthase adenylyltransferase
MEVEVIQQVLEEAATAAVGESVTIVGLGNIGSFTADLIARVPHVKRIILVDSDVFEEKNRSSQNMPGASAVGKSKVAVVARRLRTLRPDLQIESWAMRVQDVPLGNLRADVICGCLDSRLARVYVNEAARILGVPWVDAGVEPSRLLARVNVYRPGTQWPCYECAFSEEDYRHLEVAYPCSRHAGGAATNAPASLGALAAGLQAIEAVKVLRGQWSLAAVGKQITVAAGTHRHYVTTIGVNPQCRCRHEARPIEPAGLRKDDTLGQLAEKCPGAQELTVFGRTFVRQMVCPECAYRSQEMEVARLSGRMPPRRQRCPKCRAAMQPLGFSQTDALDFAMLRQRHGHRALASFGLEDGDVVTLRGAGPERHLLLGAGDSGSLQIQAGSVL